MKTILVDCDGVLLNWNQSFSAWMLKSGFPIVRADAYEISDRYCISRDRAGELVLAFNESPTIGTLGPQDDAVEGVRRLHFERGYKFTVISSVGDSFWTLMDRRHNLYRVFGAEPFDQIICLPCGGSKESTLRRFAPGLWWIEDKPENAELGQKLGFNSLLYTLPHNVDYKTDIPRVNSWKEIVDTIR